jgi:hypothetical protein
MYFILLLRIEDHIDKTIASLLPISRSGQTHFDNYTKKKLPAIETGQARFKKPAFRFLLHQLQGFLVGAAGLGSEPQPDTEIGMGGVRQMILGQ